MGKDLQFTTIQSIRAFLNRIGAKPDPTLSSDQVVRLLKSKIIEHRNDKQTQQALASLIGEIKRSELNGYESESNFSGRDLADEIAGMIGHRSKSIGDNGLLYLTTIAASVLMLWMLSPLSCSSSSDNGDSAGQPACEDDLSAAHFNDLAEQSAELSAGQIDTMADDYNSLTVDKKENIIADLCSMSVDDIAGYLENRFGEEITQPDDDQSDDDLNDDTTVDDDTYFDDDTNVDDDTNADDDFLDDDVAYKGVSF